MHFQATIPNWPEALLALPYDPALDADREHMHVIKCFDQGMCKAAVEVWTGAGRSRKSLAVILRHHGLEAELPPRHWTVREMMDWWEQRLLTFVDGGYVREFAQYIDGVSEANEYASLSTWVDDADKGAGVLRSIEAVSACWNERFRGRVRQAGDGEGLIPASTRMFLYAGTVSNPVPRRVFEIAKRDNNVVDYHGYAVIVRDPDGRNPRRGGDDWENHSGRLHRHEQEYGIKCLLYHGERAPYTSRDGGWLRSDCLDGDEDALVEIMGEVWRDEQQTPAYREGRLYGSGALFTSGNIGWKFYQLGLGPLKRLHGKLGEIGWRPGQERDMLDLAQIRADALAIRSAAEQGKVRISNVMNHAQAALAHQDAIIAKADDIILKTAPVHDLRDKTNQQVFNLFAATFGGALYWGRLVAAVGQDHTLLMLGNRSSLYTGPAIEQMLDLTQAERDKLIAALNV